MELVKLEMTPKERKIAYARGEEVDRIPTSLSAGETAPPLYGISIRDYYFSADAMVEVESRLAEDFQADNMGMGLGLRTLVEALGQSSSIRSTAFLILKSRHWKPLMTWIIWSLLMLKKMEDFLS